MIPPDDAFIGVVMGQLPPTITLQQPETIYTVDGNMLRPLLFMVRGIATYAFPLDHLNGLCVRIDFTVFDNERQVPLDLCYTSHWAPPEETRSPCEVEALAITSALRALFAHELAETLTRVVGGRYVNPHPPRDGSANMLGENLETVELPK